MSEKYSADEAEQNNSSVNRRSVLQILGTGVASLTLVGSAKASEKSSLADTNFNPSNNDSIRNFAEQFRNISKSEQEKVVKELTDGQREALKKAFRPARTEVEIIPPTSQSPSQQQTISPQASKWGQIKIKGYSTLGSHIWDWFHRITWHYDGGTSVWNVNGNDWADVHDVTWSYEGTASSSKNVDTKRATTFRQGKLSFIGGGYSFKANPSARLEGWADGSFNVLSSDKGY